MLIPAAPHAGSNGAGKGNLKNRVRLMVGAVEFRCSSIEDASGVPAMHMVQSFGHI